MIIICISFFSKIRLTNKCSKLYQNQRRRSSRSATLMFCGTPCTWKTNMQNDMVNMWSRDTLLNDWIYFKKLILKISFNGDIKVKQVHWKHDWTHFCGNKSASLKLSSLISSLPHSLSLSLSLSAWISTTRAIKRLRCVS